ncbi:MAG: hypothetical protein CVV33_09945 [Methanomicrobiales archaeon HGW-Methanomicrobiales-4]|nr:MAG: hypothetical protein CVV33_09945 [Methanomicrobiales archaeon HGW-Methanomicrobiales-4]
MCQGGRIRAERGGEEEWRGLVCIGNAERIPGSLRLQMGSHVEKKMKDVDIEGSMESRWSEPSVYFFMSSIGIKTTLLRD